jgi:ferrous iron transport protein B
MAHQRLTVALTGNPNSGKSTVFNAVTGSRQVVGNYPGVTVEKTQGYARRSGTELTIVDLPGTYSLTAQSLDEVVSRDFLLDESPDVVVDVIDSSNLERGLYLAVQLMELGAPLVLAFNMSDVALSRGYDIRVELLAKLLGVPIVRTTAHKGRGVDELLDRVLEVAADPRAAVARHRLPNYGQEVEPHVAEMAGLVAQACPAGHHERWFALKLLEGDERTARRLRGICPGRADDLLGNAGRLREHIRTVCGDPADIILADRRYGYIAGACTEAVTITVEARHRTSDAIDAVLTNRYLGLPIFAVLMYVLFQLTFALGNPLVALMDAGKEHLAEWVRAIGDQGLLASLLADGVIEGAGAVVAFLPLIMLLYVGISILQDSGYMARAAFVLDSLMHRIGLHGKSFIPMLIGFGCTVPAVMSTRILDTRRDRLTTLLVLPLMSCGARLPVYVLIIGALFHPRTYYLGPVEISNQGLMLFGVYALGIALAIACVKVIRTTVLRGEAGAFVMELPPYRVPAFRGVLVHTWERSREYLKKAGTIILAIVVVLWALKTWPALPPAARQHYQDLRAQAAAQSAAEAASTDDGAQLRARLVQIDADEHRDELLHSTIGRIGRGIAPVLRPCGFDWKISTALLGSLAAKEVFIGQMGVIYSVSDAEAKAGVTLRTKLAANYTPLQGVCIMLFILIASPCAATIAVTVRESGSWKWAAAQWTYLTVLAWVVATIVYQAFGALGVGTGPPGPGS